MISRLIPWLLVTVCMADEISKHTWHYYLKGHEFVIWLGCPRVDFHRALQSNDQKFDPFVFYWNSKKSTGQYRGGTLSSFSSLLQTLQTCPSLSIHPNQWEINAERWGTGSRSRFSNIRAGCPHPPQCCAGLRSIPWLLPMSNFNAAPTILSI